MSTKINITNTQNMTTTTSNMNSGINTAASSNTFVVPSRRTVFLLSSNPSLAITSNGENTSATLCPFIGSPEQTFLTNFDLFENSFIISSVDNRLFLGPFTDTDIAPVGLIRSLGTPIPGPPTDNGDNGGGDLPPNPAIPWMRIQPEQPTNNGFALTIPMRGNTLSLITQNYSPDDCLPLFLTRNQLEFLIVFLP